MRRNPKKARALMDDLPAFRLTASFALGKGVENVGTVVDQLGQVRAKRVELEKREETLKEILVANGEPAVEGELFRVTVSESESTRFDADLLRAFVEPKLLKKCERTVEKTTVRVSARTGEGVSAAA